IIQNNRKPRRISTEVRFVRRLYAACKTNFDGVRSPRARTERHGRKVCFIVAAAGFKASFLRDRIKCLQKLRCLRFAVRAGNIRKQRDFHEVRQILRIGKRLKFHSNCGSGRRGLAGGGCEFPSRVVNGGSVHARGSLRIAATAKNQRTGKYKNSRGPETAKSIRMRFE